MWKNFFRAMLFWKRRSLPVVPLNPHLMSVYFGNVRQGK